MNEKTRKSKANAGKKKISKKNPNIAFAIVLVVLLALTVILILSVRISKDNSKYTYNNFPFEKQNILWVTYVQKEDQPYKIPFYYHPSELEDIVAEEGAEQSLLEASVNKTKNTTVLITLDPELESQAVVAAVEISRITGSRYNMLNLQTHGALTRHEQGLANTQNIIATCEDADEDTIVIYMTLSKANFIHVEDGCIVLEGMTNEDLSRVADRFAYMLLGIMH